MYTTAWLIGSIRGLTPGPVTIASSFQVIPPGSYYLSSASTSLSLLAALVARMLAAGLALPSAVLTRDRKVKLGAAAPFSLAWGANTALRDLLGFSADLAGASQYVAPLSSPLLWSPAKPIKSEASPRGTLGIRRPLAYYSMSPTDGSTFVVSHGDRIDQAFSCTHIQTSRMQTAKEAGGEWARFFQGVISTGASFFVYLDVLEDPGATTTASLSDGLGPYVNTPTGLSLIHI